MNNHQLHRIGGMLAFALLAFGSHMANAMELQDCRLESAVVTGAVSARCGWYDVKEDRSSPSSTHIHLHVAVVPALRRQALPDPVFIISGGPGQAASDFYLSAAHAFEEMRRDRDLVIVDQRGTGKSRRLDCKLPDELESARIDAELIKKYTRDCLTKLNADPRFYTTSVAVRDLEDVRAALGYEQINIYGISYGTRVAQHYLRRYSNRIRTIVLDGVVPVDSALGPEVATAAQAALDAILERCAMQNDCAQAFPKLKEELAQLLARLTKNAMAIQVADPRTGVLKRIDFSYMHLAAALRLHSYSADTASLLPYLIHAAADDRPELMAAQALLVSRDLNEQVANGMHNAVVCTEDVPFITAEALRDPAIDRSYLRRYFIDTLMAMCSVWPRGVIDDDFHARFVSDVPALLLSGGNDPVTPNEYGERAARNFKHGLHLVVPGHGHGQLNNPCIARLMSKFVERGSSANLNVECVAKQGAAPFMLSATGPSP